MIRRVTVCQGVGCRFLAPSWPDADCPHCGGTLVSAAIVGDEEVMRLRQLERVVLNQLGTTDPRTVAEWIVAAQAVLVPDVGEGKPFSFRPLSLPSHVARCAPTPEPQPQADGEPNEQDVIGLLLEHTARVEHPLRAVPASVDGC